MSLLFANHHQDEYMTTKTPPKDQPLTFVSIFILVILCASWGLQQVAIKYTNQGISPILQGGIRSIGASILLVMWMLFRRERFFEIDGTFKTGVTIGFLFSIQFLLIYWGLDFTNASRAVIFLYTSPFVVAIGAHLFIPGENLGKWQILGLSCAFIGIIVAFGESLSLPSLRMFIGDCMLAASAVIWGTVTVLIKKGPMKQVKASKILLYQIGVSATLLPIASLLMREPGIIKLTPLIIWSIAYQTVWIAFVTYLTWMWFIRIYPIARLSSFTFLTPLFGVMAGVLFLNEPVTIALLIALLLVGSGIYMVNRPDVKKTNTIKNCPKRHGIGNAPQNGNNST